MTNDKLAELIEEIAVNTESYYKQDVLRTARDRLRDEWIPIKDFLKEPVEGTCWVVFKEEVVDSYFDTYDGVFCYGSHSENRYNSNWITFVMPIRTPEMPR